MLGRFRALELFAFSAVALVIVLGAEASQVVAESFLAAEEDRMLAMVNDHRAGRGLQPVRSDDALRWVARRHASRMADRGSIYHNPSLAAEADRAVPGWRALGENVGTGPSVETVQGAFLNSPKHRANIETARFDTAGVGGVADAEGRRYYTQNFADWTPPPPPPPTAPPPPPPPAPAAPDAPAPPSPPATAPAQERRVEAAATAERPEPAPAVGAEPSSEVLGQSADEGGSTGGTETARVGFLETILGMFVRFVELVSFWS